MLTAKLAWQHNFGDLSADSVFAFTGGRDFHIDGAPMSRNSAVAGLGLTARINDRAAVTLRYDGALGDNSQRHSGTGLLTISW